MYMMPATASVAQAGALLTTTVVIIFVILSLGVSIGLAFIPANIAKKKGYSYGGFYVFGLFLFLIALIVSLCIEDTKATKISKGLSTADELKKYKELYDNGVITEEEFNEKKKQLLK